MLLDSDTKKHVQLNDVDGDGNETVIYPQSTSDDIIVNDKDNRLTQFLTTATSDLGVNGSPIAVLETTLNPLEEEEIKDDLWLAIQSLK